MDATEGIASRPADATRRIILNHDTKDNPKPPLDAAVVARPLVHLKLIASRLHIWFYPQNHRQQATYLQHAWRWSSGQVAWRGDLMSSSRGFPIASSASPQGIIAVGYGRLFELTHTPAFLMTGVARGLTQMASRDSSCFRHTRIFRQGSAFV